MRSIGLLLAIALAIGILSISWRQIAAARQTGGDGLADELTANHGLGQTFQAPFSGLYRVDVMVSNHAQDQGRILFHLCDGVGGPEIATIEIDADQIRNGTARRFTFEPIADSADRVFYFYLEAPDVEPGNTVSVWGTDFDSYSGGQAYLNEKTTGGDLRFTAYYRSNPKEVWSSLAERIRSWHPDLWQVRWLVLIAAVALTLGTGALLGELLIAGTKKA